ncbi:MAG: hypothetical protein HC897_05995 [Thermoanaerobaculia bacterium]|nr:hypothetical protein [Thermoanaerobaculia bacterium]
MSSAITYNTPADINDFPNDPIKEQAVASQWNTNMTGFTWQAILGNPWNLLYASNQVDYFDTTVTTIPPGSTAVIVSWHAFPNRLTQYLGQGASPANPYNYNPQQLLAIADQFATAAVPVPAFQQIPTVLCPQANWQQPLQMYGPYGPRGWQDEYCEWCVVRDPDSQKITRIDFTCENPEYWNTLWMIDPQRVVELYNETLNWGAPAEAQIVVELEDLYLFDPNSNQVVIDPSTGRPAYNPLNKWNSGPIATRPTAGSSPGSFSGGAMHLTATPNTLQTEMQLAGGATIQRTIGNTQAQPLICCAQYGQAYRNSDPHIGQSVNQVVSGPNKVALANPSGLYIQVPDLSSFTLPADPNLPTGAKAQDCWQIVRGSETLIDPITGQAYGLPGQGGNFVLHAVFQIPTSWVAAGVSFTVGDILDASQQPIQWGGQVVQMMDIGLWARPIALAQTPAAESCVLPPPNGVEPPPDSPTPPSYAQPLQLFHQDVWSAYYQTSVANPMNNPIPLASNSTLIAPLIAQGASDVQMVLTCSAELGPNAELPQVSFGADIQVTSVALDTNVFYAVPGNSYPSTNAALTVLVSVSPAADLGLRSLTLTTFDATGPVTGAAMPALLNVVTAI